VQFDGILDVVDGFLLRFALTVAALESGARNEITIGVRFDDDGKSDVLHDSGHCRSALGTGKTEFAEECGRGRPTHGKESKAPHGKSTGGATA